MMTNFGDVDQISDKKMHDFLESLSYDQFRH
jgi:hypothetical protein